jgi:Mce-associated membrane protein
MTDEQTPAIPGDQTEDNVDAVATLIGPEATADSETDGEAEPFDALDDELEPAPQRRPDRRTVTELAILLAVAAALIAVGVVALVRTSTLRTHGPMANHALTDKNATEQVIGQVSTALAQVLSYDYTKPQLAQQAAKRWLAGDAPKQYQTLFAELQKLAPGQHLTLTARVVTAGVKSLDGGTAHLLVFVDQQSTRASDNASSVSAAQVQITAVKHGGMWQITYLSPL